MAASKVPDEPTIRALAKSGGTVAAHRIDWKNPAKLSDEELLGFVTGQYEAGKARRYDWERRASLQLAWVRGEQHLAWNERSNQLEPENWADLPLECRDPIIINRLRGFLLDAMAMIVAAPLSWDVLPLTRENDDVASSKAQASLIRHFWGSCSPVGQIKLTEAFWMMFATGIVWARCTWDPFAGRSKTYGAPMMRKQGEEDTPETRKTWMGRFKDWYSEKTGGGEVEGDVELPEGDIDLEFVSGFDVTEPEHCHLVEEAPWIIISRFRTVEYLRERYGKAAEDVEADSQETLQEHRAYDFAAGPIARTGDSVAYSEPHEVLVHELWRPVSPSAPKGACAIMTSARVLKKGPHPYIDGQIPLVTFREHGEPESFRPNCTIGDQMGLQRARNRQRSLLHAHMRQSIDPRFLNEKGSGVSDDAMSLWPKVVDVNEGGIDKFKPIQYPSPPAYMGELDAMNSRDMDDVGRVHRSTQGGSEFAGQSGKHAELLITSDLRAATTTRLLFEASAGRLGAMILCRIWQYYTEKRSVQITGERGRLSVLTFEGRTLISRPPYGPDAANVRASLGEVQTMEHVVSKVQGLTQLGWLDPTREEHRAMVMRWINERVPTDVDEEAEHRANAAMENEILVEGSSKDRAALRVAYGDNDTVHIREHESLTTTARWKEAVAKNAGLELLWMEHLYEHLASRATKAMQPQVIGEMVKQNIVETMGRVLKRSSSAGGPAGGMMPGGGTPPNAAPAPPGPPMGGRMNGPLTPAPATPQYGA